MRKPIKIGSQGVSLGGRLATRTEPASPTYTYLTQEEELGRLGFNSSQINEIIAKRFATNLTSDGSEYIPPDTVIPEGLTIEPGATWVDPELGFQHTIVEVGNTIINCEKHYVNDDSITFSIKGSGTTSTRSARFFRFGLEYPVRGQTGNDAHIITIDTKLTGDSNGAGDRARNGWFISDTLFAWVSGSAEISYIDISSPDSPVQTFSFTFPDNGSDPDFYINTSTSDAADCRRNYTGPLNEERISAYNAGNPSVQIDAGKVYRIFHVSADKKSYIVLVYTIATDSWSFLTGTGLNTSESTSPVVQTAVISGNMDHFTLTASGKGGYSNTEGDGFNYHHIDGTKVVQLASWSNHKGYCTLNGVREGTTEKATGGVSSWPQYSGQAGDMLMLELQPETAAIIGYPILKIPPSESSGGEGPEYGGDQNGHPGSRVAVLAGHRDEQPDDDETFSHQIVILDPQNSNLGSPDEFSLGRFRMVNLSIATTAGGDSRDPGAYMGKDFEHPDWPGRITGEVYWTGSDMAQGSTILGDLIIRTIVPIEAMIGGLPALKAAMTVAGYESRQ